MDFIHQLGGLSYLGVFGISLIATIVLPFPEEITLVSLGYLAGVGVFKLYFLIPICILGLAGSDFFIYQLAYHGQKITVGFYNKVFASRFNFLKDLHGERLDRVIIFARFLIYFRFLSGFLAGYYRMPLKRFFSLELVSLVVYVPLFLSLGFFLRAQLDKVIDGVGIVQHIILLLVIIILGTLVFKSLKKYIIQSVESGKIKF